MRKLLSAFLIMALTASNAFSAWDGGKPAGSDNISDIDTLVQANNTALENTLGGLTGWQNLAVSYTSTASVTVTADSLYLQDATGISYRATSVSEVITITTSGASGLVTSLSEASGTWYYVYIARKSADGTTNGFLSTSASLTTALTQFDSGYDQAALVSAVRNDGSSNFISFKQVGNEYQYSTWQTMASGNVGSSWVSIDTSTYVPSGLSSQGIGSIFEQGGYVAITNTSSASTGETVQSSKFGLNPGSNTHSIYWELSILTADTLYWASTSTTNVVTCSGFRINKL